MTVMSLALYAEAEALGIGLSALWRLILFTMHEYVVWHGVVCSNVYVDDFLLQSHLFVVAMHPAFGTHTHTHTP